MKIVPISVSYVDHMGDDLSVVNAARVSFHKESNEFTSNDNKLINYLAIHNHWTPFGHTSISLRLKAPIFVARQAGKHQVGFVWNEVSRRYVDEEPEFYSPKEWRGRADNVKQGSAGVVVPKFDDDEITFNDAMDGCLFAYTNLLEKGIAPEQARMILPQNMMTEWIWTGSLAAFSRVCKLRLDPHSQMEIQELAGMIKAVVEPLFPGSWAALEGVK